MFCCYSGRSSVDQVDSVRIDYSAFLCVHEHETPVRIRGSTARKRKRKRVVLLVDAACGFIRKVGTWAFKHSKLKSLSQSRDSGSSPRPSPQTVSRLWYADSLRLFCRTGEEAVCLNRVPFGALEVNCWKLAFAEISTFLVMTRIRGESGRCGVGWKHC